MNTFNINRRRFLQTSSTALAMGVLGAYGADLVNRKPRKVGLIGAGWYGKSDLFRLIQVAPVEVPAICEVDRRMASDAADRIGQRLKTDQKPRIYNDYREMLNNHPFDIILIGSPDHWHALQMIESVKAGAHVYVQKPISVDVMEGEAMVATARKYNKVVQVGTQRKSTPHLIDAKNRIVDAGLLGKVSHVEMCCYYHMRANGNPPLEPVPDFLDYEMWTGPAPLRPYDGLPHLRWWRTFMEYGNGIMGDMCIHMLDTVRWMLKLGWPRRIHSIGGIYVDKEGKSNIADTQTATFEYPDLSAVWQHRSWGDPPDPDYPWALFLYGEKGTLKASVRRADFIPRGDGEKIHFESIDESDQYPEDKTEPNIELFAAPATRRHMLDFLTAIDKGTRPVADIEDGHISTASCILANLSMETGNPLEYNPSKQRIENDRTANRRLERDYRDPWRHPDPKKV